MHGAALVSELLYGTDGGRLYVRIDRTPADHFKIEFEGSSADTQIAKGDVVELSAPRASSRFRVLASRDGLPPESIPANGWIG